MEGAQPDDFGRSGAVRQTAQKFSAAKPQLPPYPPIKQKPKLNHSSSSASQSSTKIPASIVPTSTSSPTIAKDVAEFNPICLPQSISESNASQPVDLESIDLAPAVRRQLQLRARHEPFVFTLMVVGASGLGKSTFINQLFECPLYDPEVHPAHPQPEGETVEVRVHPVRLQEQQVQLSLNLVDTPGFGDTLNGSSACQQVLRFIEQQLDSHLQAETHLKSDRQSDQRVHCCLYFIQPGRHQPLRPLDVTLLKTLQYRVNLVPVIAKADTLTPTELAEAKRKVRIFCVFWINSNLT
jgi:GTP-binding protein EngB required for normal cell division